MKKTLRPLIPSALTNLARLGLLTGFLGMATPSCQAADALDDRRPNEHFCPITLEVMRDPVVAADGHSYERSAILTYLNSANRAKSPVTGAPLKNKDLFDNQALKAMIREWKPERQSGPSALETRSAADIAQRVKEEFRKNAVLLNSAKDQHIVAFLGNTGAGKSTLVNFLAGKEIRVSDDEEDYVLVNPHDPTAMVTGTGGNSETLYPKFIDVDGLRFFDLPGFNDTDGTERNLVNAAFTRQILLDAASVRLVFVAGQDQFTADRSASIKQMFHSLKRLFVVDQGVNLVDDGVFVATKVTCNERTDLTEFLVKKTDARDKVDLNEQLKAWSQRNKLARMFHPVRQDNNRGVRDHILRLIQETRPARILGLNVSVLYPPDTQGPLERMFVRVFEGAFERKLTTPMTTLSDYDRVIALHAAGNFWQMFEEDVCREEEAMGLLKAFCVNPYNKALRDLQKENEGKRQAHIQALKSRRQERIGAIEIRTEERAKEVISSLVPRSDRDEYVAFDFAFHKDFYDQVCGLDSIGKLATDPSEQEVVRRHYAGFISQHSHEQMMRWHERFSGMEKLISRLVAAEQGRKDLARQLEATQTQLEATQNKLYTLVEEPLIKAREAEAEKKRRQEAERAAEAKRQRRLQAQRAAEEERQRREQIEKRLAYPLVTRGYEEIYERFLNGRLIYKPDANSDAGKIELRIGDLANPLAGTFDLSRCGDRGRFLSISTGYRKGKKAENKDKVEIWFVPRFLVEREIEDSARHFKAIFPAQWPEKALFGIFWTWGNWDTLEWYDYLTTQSMDDLGNQNLYDKEAIAEHTSQYFRTRITWFANLPGLYSTLQLFSVHFMSQNKD